MNDRQNRLHERFFQNSFIEAQNRMARTHIARDHHAIGEVHGRRPEITHRQTNLDLLGWLHERRQPRASRCSAPSLLCLLHRVHRRDGRPRVQRHARVPACVLRDHGRMLVGPYRLLRHAHREQVGHEGAHPHAHRRAGTLHRDLPAVLADWHVRDFRNRRPVRLVEDRRSGMHRHRSVGQIGPAAVLHVAAFRNGSSHARFGLLAWRVHG